MSEDPVKDGSYHMWTGRQRALHAGKSYSYFKSVNNKTWLFPENCNSAKL